MDKTTPQQRSHSTCDGAGGTPSAPQRDGGTDVSVGVHGEGAAEHGRDGGLADASLAGQHQDPVFDARHPLLYLADV